MYFYSSLWGWLDACKKEHFEITAAGIFTGGMALEEKLRTNGNLKSQVWCFVGNRNDTQHAC